MPQAPAVTVTVHPDYPEAVAPLKMVRDCVEGSTKIKRMGELYLPHPCAVDKESQEQRMRYAKYKLGAEFDSFTDLTRRGWVGKMRLNSISAELPDRIAYLVQNADGDGTPITSSVENCASNIFQTKYHILIADYQGLSDVAIDQLSKADVQRLRPRASIKQYTRESLVDWGYRRMNGVMQLNYLKLREWDSVLDVETGNREEVESYLILALDVDGNYYQQKVVKGVYGERDYVTVGGSPLTWIPAEIVADEELPVGALPRGMGMLFPIAEAALYRYRVSADYKEAMSFMVPTTFTRGWQPSDMDTFEQINGRRYIQFGSGAANNLPGEVDVKIESANTQLEGFERYFDANSDKVRALGGVMKDKPQTQRTATEADIDASEQNALLNTVADSLEHAYKRVISYCAMFEGLWSPDEVENRLDEIVLNLPRDFASPKLSVEEVKQLGDMFDRGIRTREQLVKALAAGGWDIQDAEQTLEELEQEAPRVSTLAGVPSGGGQTEE